MRGALQLVAGSGSGPALDSECVLEAKYAKFRATTVGQHGRVHLDWLESVLPHN